MMSKLIMLNQLLNIAWISLLRIRRKPHYSRCSKLTPILLFLIILTGIYIFVKKIIMIAVLIIRIRVMMMMIIVINLLWRLIMNFHIFNCMDIFICKMMFSKIVVKYLKGLMALHILMRIIGWESKIWFIGVNVILGFKIWGDLSWIINWILR